VIVLLSGDQTSFLTAVSCLLDLISEKLSLDYYFWGVYLSCTSLLDLIDIHSKSNKSFPQAILYYTSLLPAYYAWKSSIHPWEISLSDCSLEVVLTFLWRLISESVYVFLTPIVSQPWSLIS